MDLDLRKLKYFVAVAEELHFGRAAERLHVAQPALSRQIRSLEESLTATLFDRTTRSVTLTPAGRRLFERSQGLLTEADLMVDEVARIANGEEGTLRVGFVGSASFTLMPQFINALRRGQPLVHVDLRSDQLSSELADDVAAGALDLAVLRPCPAAQGLHTVTLREEQLVVVLAESHPLAQERRVRISDLAHDEFILYPQPQSAMAVRQHAACTKAGFEPRVAAHVRETSTLIAFVASGLGVSLVPRAVEALQLPGVVFKEVDGATPGIPLLAAHLADTPNPLVGPALTLLRQGASLNR